MTETHINQLKRQRIKKKYRELFTKSNWNIAFGDEIDQEIDLFAYVVHVETGLVKLLGLCNHKDSPPSTLTLDQLATQAGNLIHLYATNAYQHMLNEKEMLELLGASIGEYAKRTQSYQVACDMAGQVTPRILVMHMADPLNKDSMFVRPNPLPDKNLSGEDIQALARLILAQDRQNHPERFKSAQVLAFKANKVEI